MRFARFTLGLLLGAVAVGAVISSPLGRHPLAVYSLAREKPAPQIVVPVDGIRRAQLNNSWGAPRSGGRRHEGIDIAAPLGTPIRSATPGLVMSLGENRLGGRIVRVLGPGLEWHYYAHLDRFGPFVAGDLVQAGDIIGYVGTTGNARGTPPHLHYGIYTPAGAAQNPYTRLAERISGRDIVLNRPRARTRVRPRPATAASVEP